MTYVKKSLAVLLAFVMIFSTVSIAATAAETVGNALSFKIVMYRKDGDSWVATTRAKPGEQLKARLFLGTDYGSTASTIAMAWDKQYFSTSYTTDELFYDGVGTNTTYDISASNVGTNTVQLSTNGSMQYSASEKNDFLANVSMEILNKYDLLSTILQVQGTRKLFKWDVNQWAAEYTITVNDNAYVRNSVNSGEVKVPAEFASHMGERVLIDVPQGQVGDNSVNATSMTEFEASITTTPASISVFSDIVLDANGGKFGGTATTKTISGVIGDSVTGLFDTANTPANSGKQFMGWSLTQNGAVLDADGIAALKYDYTDGKLYAIWSDEVTDSTWKYEIYKEALIANGDGTYSVAYLASPDFVSAPATVPVNSPVSIPTAALSYTGFTLDTVKSTTSANTPADGELLVLKAYFKRDTHTVKYFNEDDSVIDTITAYYGQPMPALSADKVPSKAGHTLAWTPALPTTVGTANFEAKATFTAQKYLLTFNAGEGSFEDGDSKVKSLEFDYNEAGRAITDVPVRTGYTFKCWQTVSGSGIPEKVVENVTLHAVYDPIDYSITFTVNGSTGGSAPAPISGKHVDDYVTLPALPDAAGYTVTGWHYGNATYAPNTNFKMPAANVTMNAVTEANTYTINFNTNGGSYVAPIGAKYDEAIPKADFSEPVKDNAEFKGWANSDGVLISYPYYVPIGGITLEALWEVTTTESTTEAPTEPSTEPPTELPSQSDTYAQVSYAFIGTVPAGAEELLPDTSLPCVVGSEVPLAAAPTLANYDFHGWYYNGNLCTSITMPAAGATVTGYWTEKTTTATGTVIFYDGTTVHRSFTKAVGATVAKADVPDPSKTGHTFVGWTDTDGNAPSFPISVVAGTKAYFAKWEQVPAAKTGTIKFYKDTLCVKSQTSTVDTLVTFPDSTGYTKEGFTFDGWLDESGNKVSDAIVKEGVRITETEQVYFVKWKANTTGQVIFCNDTTVLGNVTDTIGTEVPFPAGPFTKAGFEAKGWIKAGSSTPINTEKVVIEAGTQIYFVNWVAVKTGTVNFYNDSVLVDTKTDVVGEKVNIPAGPFSKPNYTFGGWIDGAGNSVTSPVEIVEGTTNYYIKWVPDEEQPTGTVTFLKTKDATTAEKSVSDVDGATVTPPATTSLVNPGYEFDGWYDAANDTLATEFKVVAGTTKTYYAKWKAVDLTVTYYLVKGATESLGVQTYKHNDTITPLALPKGYESEGWVDENGTPLPEKMGTENLVVYPKNLTTKKYILTFDANGGYFDGNTSKTQVTSEVNYLAPIVQPENAPTRDGFNFAGWQPSVSDKMPNEDTTYNAVWIEIPVVGEQYTATFISDGKVFSLYNVTPGDAIPDPGTPKKFGYTFAGWDPEVPATMPEYNVEFVAKWEKNDNFLPIVIGGTVIAGGVIATIAGINTAIIAGAAIVGGIIVIATVAKNTYTVTYVVDGETYKTYKVLAGTKIPVPAEPTKDGYKFAGWDPEVPAKMPAADQTFTAKWTAETDVEIPATGSASAGITAFGIISAAAAAAYVITKKKRED